VDEAMLMLLGLGKSLIKAPSVTVVAYGQGDDMLSFQEKFTGPRSVGD